MLRSRFTLAVLFSIILIFGAIWIRIEKVKAQNSIATALIAEQQRQAEQDALLQELIDKNTPPETKEAEKLTDTDLIGRQLFGDYVNLISKGQATSDNLNILADKYAGNILTASKAKVYTLSDIRMVEDSADNFIVYGNELSRIRNKYKDLTNKIINDLGGVNKLENNIDVFASKTAKLYQQSLNELTLIPIPKSLVEKHLILLNSYSKSTENSKALGNLKSDPATAFSSLNSQAENGQLEENTITEIGDFLKSKGISLNLNT